MSGSAAGIERICIGERHEVVPSDAVDGIPDCRILQEVRTAMALRLTRGFLWTSGISGRRQS